jgi:hypothetical protein
MFTRAGRFISSTSEEEDIRRDEQPIVFRTTESKMNRYSGQTKIVNLDAAANYLPEAAQAQAGQTYLPDRAFAALTNDTFFSQFAPSKTVHISIGHVIVGRLILHYCLESIREEKKNNVPTRNFSPFQKTGARKHYRTVDIIPGVKYGSLFETSAKYEDMFNNVAKQYKMSLTQFGDGNISESTKELWRVLLFPNPLEPFLRYLKDFRKPNAQAPVLSLFGGYLSQHEHQAAAAVLSRDWATISKLATEQGIITQDTLRLLVNFRIKWIENRITVARKLHENVPDDPPTEAELNANFNLIYSMGLSSKHKAADIVPKPQEEKSRARPRFR